MIAGRRDRHVVRACGVVAGLLLIISTGVLAQNQVTETNPEGKRVEQALATRKPAPPLTPQDYADIQLLYARSARSFDSGADAGGAFASAFTPDGIYIDMTTGKISQGPAQLADLAKVNVTAGSTVPPVRHFIHSLMIERAPEGATAKAYVAVLQAADGQQATAIDSGQYWDVLEKTPAGWRFRKRNFHRATLAPPNVTAPAPAASTNR